MKQLLEEAKKMIRINSVTVNGNEELANYASQLLQDHGLKTQLQHVTHSLENVSKRQFNVIGILGDPLVDKKTRKGLLLLTHLDTTTPGLAENWNETQNDPFSAKFQDGKVIGLGAANSKLDFLCKLHAIEKYREKKLRMPIYVVGTCAEEAGMIGARYLIKSLALNPKYVVIGQSTDLKVVFSHKAMNLFRINIDYQLVERDARGFNRKIDLQSLGRSAHGSYPHLGINAITQALDFLQMATDSGFELRFTHLEGGDVKNKVPDRARAEFYLTSHQFEDFKRFFRETIRSQGKEKQFRVELGGLGDMGVRFLPDPIFPCIMEVVNFFRKVSQQFQVENQDSSFQPPFPTINLGNMVQRPTGLDMFFDARFFPTQEFEVSEKAIFDGIKSIATRFPHLNVTISREKLNPGLNMTAEHELVRICKNAMIGAGIEPGFDKASTSSEAAQFFQSGFETVVFGPGSSQNNSHSPNEFVNLDQLEKATLFYEKLIERVCL